jgi:Tfp pilus assembly protein PilF
VLLLVAGALALAGRWAWQQHRAWEAWRAAHAALEVDDFETARRLLAECRDAWPRSAETHFLLARTCRRAELPAAARSHLQDAERLGWSQDDIDLERLLTEAQESGPRGITEQTLIARLKADRAAAPFILEALITGFARIQRLAAAQYWLDYWVENFPDDGRAACWRGDFALRMHNLGAAEVDLRRALELRPDHADTHRLLARTLLQAGNRVDEAAEYFRALTEGPDPRPDDLVGLARCQRFLNRPAEARDTLARAFQREPDTQAGLLTLALLEADAENFAAVEAILPRLNPDLLTDSEDLFRLATLELATAKARRGPAEVRAAEQRLAQLQADLAGLSQAEAELRRGLSAEAFQRRVGLIYLRIGWRREGLRVLSQYLQKQPGDAEVQAALAEATRSGPPGPGRGATDPLRPPPRGRSEPK